MTGTWNPAQYQRFRDERSQPFHDLLALVRPIPGGRAIDLGCGTGELTRLLHDTTGAAETIGLDNSDAMLAGSSTHVGNGLRFERGDIAAFRAAGSHDLVISNAALQWLPAHAELFPRLRVALRAGGQLAVQMPANHDHPSHLIAHDVAAEEPFRTALSAYVREVPVRQPEWYASLLYELGFETQVVRLHVYPHVLDTTGDVVEWVKGTLLTDYQARMPAPLFDEFLSRYRARLLDALGEHEPYFYAFKRILLWGQLPG
jgi:trans-aconitate 2-methyltransferase